MFSSGFIIAYVKGWKLALVVTASIPLVIISTVIYVSIIQNKDKKMAAAYSGAGGLAEEAIGAIKTVKSLTGETYETERFVDKLTEVRKKVLKYTIWSGVGIGLIFFVMLSSYALGFWYGSKLIVDQDINANGRIYSSG